MPTPSKHVAVLLLSAALGACTTTNTAERSFVDPGKYMLYSCKDLQTAIAGERKREAELRMLIAKAEGSPGGAVVGTMVYRTEYLQTRGNILVAQDTLRDKRCP
ncbi:MAG: hypothetical protein ACK4UO_07030 [Pseudolabrys sp.]